MKIAVMMSTYNGEKFLRSQIDSILNQKTEADIDLIVWDDCSKDSTRDILEEYSSQGKLKYFTGANKGAAKAFIYLLKNTTGYDYYSFSDQDDVWNEDKLQKGIDAVKGVAGPALYCTNCELVDSDLNPIGRNTHRGIPTYNLVSILCLCCCAQGCTSVFNNDFAKIIQEHDIPDVYIMHDSLVTCLCGLINGKVIYDHEPSMKYRIHGSNVFGIVSAKQGVWKVIRSRLKEITTKPKISMYEQGENILMTYSDVIPDDNQKLLKTVIASRKSLIARFKLIFNKNLKHDTLNKTLTKKASILLGND